MNVMSSEEIDSIYKSVYPLAVKAGAILLEGFKSEKDYSMKSAFYDVVTKYDTNIENFLFAEIGKLYPNHKFIGEESAENVVTKLTNEPTWIIDPIDGTSNFIKGMPHCCVAIGLSINKKIVIGIVNNSVTSTLYSAIVGKGAFKNDVKISGSSIQKVSDACIGYEVSLLHVPSIKDKHLKRINEIAPKARMTLSYGSVVMSMCYVACGMLDAYTIEDMFPWDCAAASLIISEAGGFIKHTNGGEYDIMNPHIVCAGNVTLGNEVLSLIQEADKN